MAKKKMPKKNPKTKKTSKKAASQTNGRFASVSRTLTNGFTTIKRICTSDGAKVVYTILASGFGGYGIGKYSRR